MYALARSSILRIRVAFLLAALSTWAPAARAQSGVLEGSRIHEATAAAKPSGKLDTALHGRLLSDRPQDRERLPAAARSDQLTVAFSIAEKEAAAVESLIAELGGRVLHSVSGLLEARIGVEQLTALVEDERVQAARAVVGPLAVDVVTEAAAATAPDTAAAFGAPPELDGSGVRVGIIDVGFRGYGALIGSELPPPVAVRCYLDFGQPSDRLEDCENPPPLFMGSLSSHGTAVAEALIDVSPRVELYLANPASPLDLRSTVEWMVAQGVAVINYSMYRIYEGPGDGTSPRGDSVYETIDRATARGVVWVGAAGNLARRHWRGAFEDSDADGLHEFVRSGSAGGAGNCVLAENGDLVVASLRWDDDWSAPTTDLDLVLLRQAEPVAISADRQDGAAGQLPLETISFAVESGGELCLVVALSGGAPPARLQLASFRHELTHSSPEASVAGPADAASPGTLAVGAAPWYDPTRIEQFSSWGPTTDGRLKPDLVGLDRLLSATFGGRAFVGTSQAAPLVAGLVALTRQALPSLTAAGVADVLTSSARTPEGAPPEAWGFGLAQFPSSADPATDPRTIGSCDDSTALCLDGGRFEVIARWTAGDGRRGAGSPRRLTDDSGVFTFFDRDNVELIAKVLDGCAINGRHWVYAGGLTDLAVDLVVSDTATGESRTYRQPGGAAFATIRDVTALGGCSRSSAAAGRPGDLDLDGWSETVELESGFRLSVRFTAGADGERRARGQRLGADSAAFSFFDSENVELVVKVLDGRAVNGSWWVFASGTTDVGVEIQVHDPVGRASRFWTSPAGRPFVPVLDVDAFSSCAPPCAGE